MSGRKQDNKAKPVSTSVETETPKPQGMVEKPPTLTAQIEDECIECGCTEHNACEGGCSWIPLCDKCYSRIEETKKSERERITEIIKKMEGVPDETHRYVLLYKSDILQALQSETL